MEPEKSNGRNTIDACLLHQLSPFINSVSQRPGVCLLLLKLVAFINNQIQKNLINQYLKCPLQGHKHKKKILYLVLFS